MRATILTCFILAAVGNASANDAARLKGHLVIHGGGESQVALHEFIRLAGGADARIVVIPTAAGRDEYDAQFASNYFRPFRERGVSDLRIFHTSDRRIADSDDFVAPLTRATGVWFTGGRQW